MRDGGSLLSQQCRVRLRAPDRVEDEHVGAQRLDRVQVVEDTPMVPLADLAHLDDGLAGVHVELGTVAAGHVPKPGDQIRTGVQGEEGFGADLDPLGARVP